MRRMRIEDAPVPPAPHAPSAPSGIMQRDKFNTK